MERIKLILEYALLGIVQGISEMLPISSSGHLKLFKEVMNINNNDLSLEILFHLASLLALCIFFGQRIKKLFVGNYLFVFKKKIEYKGDFRCFLMLIIASIPAGVLGLLFKDSIELIFLDIKYVGLSLMFTSIILYVTYKIKEIKEELTYSKAFKIGIFQGIGIIPGISRSGITYLGAKKNGLSNDESSSFIFMMLIPIVLGSFILSLKDIKYLLNVETIIPSLVGFFMAFIFTLLSLNWFVKVMKDKRILYFSLYCLIVGFLTIVFL